MSIKREKLLKFYVEYDYVGEIYSFLIVVDEFDE